MKSSLFVLLLAGTLGACAAPSTEVLADTPSLEVPTKTVVPVLTELITGQNDNGYTKKTTINPEICEHEEYFHYHCNGSQRATYYNAAETTLLMGNYDGTFSTINSGYKNLEDLPEGEEGIQHFKYVGTGDYFTNIDEDWDYPGQSVGNYYPTLDSLSKLINQDEDWDFSADVFSYNKSDETLLQKFQFFAAPMLLEGALPIKGIEIELDGDTLEIRLFGEENLLISTAEITKGYQ